MPNQKSIELVKRLGNAIRTKPEYKNWSTVKSDFESSLVKCVFNRDDPMIEPFDEILFYFPKAELFDCKDWFIERLSEAHNSVKRYMKTNDELSLF